MKRAFHTLIIFITLITFGSIDATAQVRLDTETVNDLKNTKQFAIGVSDERHFKGALNMYDFWWKAG